MYIKFVCNNHVNDESQSSYKWSPQNPNLSLLIRCVCHAATVQHVSLNSGKERNVSCCDSRGRESGTWTGSKWVLGINLESIQMRFGAARSTRGDWTSLALCTFNLLYDCCCVIAWQKPLKALHHLAETRWDLASDAVCANQITAWPQTSRRSSNVWAQISDRSKNQGWGFDVFIW